MNVKGNNPSAPFRPLGGGFCEHAQTNPDSTSLTIDARSISYGEAASSALMWAAALQEAAQGIPRRVGVLGSRSEVTYIGALAALKSGGAYVPLSSTQPTRRIASMIELADLDALLVGDEAIKVVEAIRNTGIRLPPIIAPRTRYALGVPSNTRIIDQQLCEKLGRQPVKHVAQPDDLAYLMFTSGSTGTPKGVPISHGNVRAFLDYNQSRYKLTREDHLTQTFDQMFDLSIFDMFMAWEAGASVHSISNLELLAPHSFLQRHNISVWFSVPSVASLLLSRGALVPSSLPTLRLSLFCGERLPKTVAEAWAAAAPNSVVENLYGPTEVTIACSSYRWNSLVSAQHCSAGTVPIGTVYPHLHSAVVNRERRLVADGEEGELCISGSQVCSGYWRQSMQTDANFFVADFDGLGEKRYYATGDRVVRQRETLAFVGRMDDQVKIGGHRIELGEVEGALREAGCSDAAVVVCTNGGPLPHLVAFIEAGSPESVRHSLRSKLPVYMIPRELIEVKQLPRGITGKVDKKALHLMVSGKNVDEGVR